MTAFDPKYALVRILEDNKAQKRPIGAGFMVAERLAMTCAHVVEGRDRVFLDFPLLGGPVYAADVDVIYPPVESPTPDKLEDIALLKFSKDTLLPGDLTPMSGEILSDSALFNETATILGFPKGMDFGDWLNDVRISGKNAAGWFQLDYRTGSRFVDSGFSGAPVWNITKTRIFGMVVGRADREGPPVGYMIPVSALERACPSIRTVSGESETAATSKQPAAETFPAFDAIRCNRLEETTQFRRFYDHCRKLDNDCGRRRPQFYIIRGRKGDGHKSFIKRLRYEFLKEKGGDSPFYELVQMWPISGGRESRLEQLRAAVSASLTGNPREVPECALDICSAACFEKYDKAVLAHNIYTETWDGLTITLISDYITEFWKNCGHPPREFLIFLNVIHDRPPAPWFRRVFGKQVFSPDSINREIEAAAGKIAAECPDVHIHLLKPLTPVKKTHAEEWWNYREYTGKEALVRIEKFFEAKTYVALEELEDLLLDILQTHHRLKNQ